MVRSFAILLLALVGAGALQAQDRYWSASQISAARQVHDLGIDRRAANASERAPGGSDTDTDITETPADAGYVVAGSGTVNARSCADTACEVVTVLRSGQALDVIEEVQGAAWRNDTRWLKVRHQVGEVYVHALLARQGAATATTTLRPGAVSDVAPTVNINQATTTWYVAARAHANARSCPRTSCRIVTSFARGAAVDVLQRVSGEAVNDNAGWQAVKHGTQVVYVHAPLLSRSRPAPTAPTAPQQQGQPAGVNAPAIGGGFALGGQALGFTFAAITCTPPA